MNLLQLVGQSAVPIRAFLPIGLPAIPELLIQSGQHETMTILVMRAPDNLISGHRIESGKQSGIRESGTPTVSNSQVVGKNQLVGQTNTPYFYILQL